MSSARVNVVCYFTPYQQYRNIFSLMCCVVDPAVFHPCCILSDTYSAITCRTETQQGLELLASVYIK